MLVNVPYNIKFNSGEYTKGCVLDYIEALKKYKVFVGFDFGDGVCTAYVSYYVITNEGKREWHHEKIEFDGKIAIDDGVPTAIVYDVDSGKKLIGKETDNYDNIYHQFKVLPEKWDNRVFNANDKTYGCLISDFLCELWNRILDNKKLKDIVDLSANAESTLIVVGHPGGSLWSDEENIKSYLDMLSNDVFNGYAVAVMPEPFAAVFGAVREAGKDNPINISNGIYIIEPGSSTTDTCYILLGKKITTGSVNCAGRDIDNAVYEYLVYSNKEKLEIDTQMLEDVSVRRAIWEIKGIKDMYCNNPAAFKDPTNRISSSRSIILFQTNPLDIDNPIKKRIDFTVNEELFDKALDFQIEKATLAGQKTVTWNSEMKNFLSNDIAASIETCNGKIACDKVILGGGTSKVPHFIKAVNEIYKDSDLIHKSENPTQIVASGLCYSKYVLADLNNHMSHYYSPKILIFSASGCVAEAQKKGNKAYLDYFADQIALYQLDSIIKYCEKSINSNSFNQRTADFINGINNISTDTTVYDFYKKLRVEFFNAFEAQQAVLRAKISELVNKAYGCDVVDLSNLTTDITALSDKGGCDFNDAIKDLLAIEKYDLFSKHELPFLSGRQQKFFNNKKDELSDPVSKEREKLIMSISKGVKKMLKNNHISDIFNEAIDVQAELYLGKALLLITEN